jgi:hypothetical protein
MPDTNTCWPILKTSIKVAHSLVCYAWQMVVSVSKFETHNYKLPQVQHFETSKYLLCQSILVKKEVA